MTLIRKEEYPLDTKKEIDDVELQATRRDERYKKLWYRALFNGLLFLFCYLIYSLAYNCAYNNRVGVSNHRDRTKPTVDEVAFLRTLEESNFARNWSQKLTSVPHLAGKGLDLVEWTASKFEEYGLETEVETFDVYLNYPVDHSLKLLNNGEVIYHPNLTEDVLPQDPTTDGDDLIPAFHGYSASGNVTSEYVYVNYGSKEDFALLHKHGVPLEGKIAIARYGQIFRGLKVKFAQEAGCSGVLLYSDPGDDLFQEAKGDKPYPLGPARNPSSLQRGSVQFLSQYPGDPTTPGRPSQGENIIREDPHQNTPKIPSLPISFKEVKPILEKLNGHGVKGSKIGGDRWVGNLPGFDYWTGPNPNNTLNLFNEQEYKIVPIHNVYGTLKGTDSKKGYILVGNHRDAWIKGGASDPNSGTSAMLEVARSLHEMAKTGWKPKRSIKFASWDGEEYGLLGSTEFGEKNADELKKNLIAYINLDVAVGGRQLKVASSPFLNKAIKESLSLVNYPLQENVTLHEHFFNTSNIGILGSGSDYTVFMEHLGVPSMDFGFTASSKDPVYHYHSNYDSFHWMDVMQDPGFKLHNTAAKLFGVLILRLSEDEIINSNVSEYSDKLFTFYKSINDNVPEEWLNKTVHHHKPLSKIIEKTIKKLNKFKKSANSFDHYLEDLRTQYEHKSALPWWKRFKLRFLIIRVNLKLKYLERAFLHEEGLKDRSWFKHIVFAPGRNTGYEGFALPGLKEAIDDNNINDFAHWNHILAHTVSALTDTFKIKH